MYKLFVDDERDPPVDGIEWVVARNSADAILTIEFHGLPSFMSLDHDLGGEDTVLRFLRWLVDAHYDAGPPDYQVHSANPVGRDNIIAYLESWRRSLG